MPQAQSPPDASRVPNRLFRFIRFLHTVGTDIEAVWVICYVFRHSRPDFFVETGFYYISE
ncbi:hypothetical protein FACS1894217_15070 [Clostridia bacterium]|nr:hypothetical protein FACS1894217_15070 [Clostridia bacterium]